MLLVSAMCMCSTGSDASPNMGWKAPILAKKNYLKHCQQPKWFQSLDILLFQREKKKTNVFH